MDGILFAILRVIDTLVAASIGIMIVLFMVSLIVMIVEGIGHIL